MSELRPGSRVGAYKILSVIGRGGMGVVYRARDDRVRREVALKVVSPELATDDRFLARLKREARAAARVSHENVARIHDVGQDGGLHFLVLELLPGGSLADRLRERGKIPWRDAARLGAGIARGLAAVHGADVLHRDLKPANVLLGDSDEPKLCDFGLAKPERRAGSAHTTTGLTQAGEILGTLEYMAPEQADQKGDARADLYSLGALLHALLTGRPPFQGSGVVLLRKHLLEKPKPVREIVPDVPEAFSDLVLELLEKEPGRRPASAQLVAFRLEAIARHEPERALPGKKRAVALAGLVVLAASGAAALAFLGRREGQAPGEDISRAVSSTLSATANAGATATAVPRPTEPRELVVQETLPEATLPFRKTGLTRLLSVWGSYAFRHGGRVSSLAVAPDGRHALTGGLDDATLRVWDLETGRETCACRAEKPIVSVYMSTDATIGLAIDEGGLIVQWRLANGERIARLRTAGHTIRCASVSLDGSDSLLGTEDGVVRYARNGELRKDFDAHEGPVLSVAFSTDGKRALSGGADGKVRLLDLVDLEATATLEVGSAVNAVEFLPEGDRALAGTEQGTLEVWDLRARKRAALAQAHEGPLRSISFGKGARVVTGGDDGKAKLWEVGSDGSLLGHAPRRTFAGQAGRVASGILTQDGARVVTAGWDGVVRVFEAETGNRRNAIPGHDGRILSVASSVDGRTVVTGGGDGKVVVWEAASGMPVRSFPARSPVTAVACSPEGDLAATGDAAGWVMVGNIVTQSLVSTAKVHESVVGLGFLPGKRLVSAGGEGRIVARDLAPSPQSKDSQLRSGDPIASFVLSDDRKRVLFSSGTKVRYASVDGEGSEPSLEEMRARVSCVAVSPDGGLGFVGAADGLLELRMLHDGKTRRLGKLTGEPIAAAFSPEGLRVLVATRQGMIRILDVMKRGELDAIDLSKAGERANALAFLPDKRTFLACTERGVVLRFELRQ